MTLSPFVKLFRAEASAKFEQGVIQLVARLTLELREAICEIYTDCPTCFEHCFVDGKSWSCGDADGAGGGKLELGVRPPTSSAERFYDSLDHFVDTASILSSGRMPDEFFLVQENWYSGDATQVPERLLKVQRLCRLVQGLERLAHYCDDRPGTGPRRLVFIVPGDGSSAPTLSFPTKITTQLLDVPVLDLKVVEELLAGDVYKEPHYQAKLDVFISTLTEFLGHASKAVPHFEYLVRNWEDFVQVYSKNFSTYISGFSFNKAKMEVAEQIFGLSERFSKLTSDIAAKVFAVAVSVGAVAALDKVTTDMGKVLVVIALATTTVIVAVAVFNQQRELKRVVHAKDIVLKSLKGRKDEFPGDLKEAVEQLEVRGRNDERTVGILLWLYQLIAWIPAILGCWILYELFQV